MERECILCGNQVYEMNTADIGIGILVSNEPAICEECYEKKPEEVAEILEASKEENLKF